MRLLYETCFNLISSFFPVGKCRHRRYKRKTGFGMRWLKACNGTGFLITITDLIDTAYMPEG